MADKEITFEDVYYEVLTKSRALGQKQRREPKVAVYMTADFRAQLLSSIQGAVGWAAMDFHQHNVICNFKVHIVVGAASSKHPDYQIVEVL